VGQLVKKSRPATKLHDHIRELLMRLFVSFIVLVLASFVVYAFYEPILSILRDPLGAPLYYSSPSGSFAFVMKISLMGALAITIPILVYNLIMFVRPAFSQIITVKRVYLMSASSLVLAISGVLFAYYIILPGSLRFFAGFQVSGLNALISADSYLGFVINIITTFIIVFQLPLLISFIDTIKPLTPTNLFKQEKWVALGSMIIALLTPFSFDILTMLFIALPIIVLYNLSIFVVLLQHYGAKRAVHSTIVKPATEQEMLIDELVLSNFSNELLPVTKPIVTARSISDHKPVTVKNNVYMDMRSNHNRSTGSRTIATIPTKKQQLKTAMHTQARTFYDIRRNPSIRQRLVLQ
jgi:sec-independent protein translocase protein TatC